jgi:hypothetical protein
MARGNLDGFDQVNPGRAASGADDSLVPARRPKFQAGEPSSQPATSHQARKVESRLKYDSSYTHSTQYPRSTSTTKEKTPESTAAQRKEKKSSR